MTEQKTNWVQRYLDPAERLSEVLFGLIMVLTFTLTAGLTVAEGPEGVRELLVAAIGCNIAWGIIDGAFYIMGAVFERGRRARLEQALRRAGDEGAAIAAVARELDPALESVTTSDGRRRLYEDIVQVVSRAEKAPRTKVLKEDLYGALASAWLVILSTIPAAAPFLIFDRPRFALRVSNGLLLGLLFLVGYQWARYTGSRRFLTGALATLLGVVLVGIAIALGG